MTLLRMDNVLLVVDDLEAAIAFFAALSMEIEGKATSKDGRSTASSLWMGSEARSS